MSVTEYRIMEGMETRGAGGRFGTVGNMSSMITRAGEGDQEMPRYIYNTSLLVFRWACSD